MKPEPRLLVFLATVAALVSFAGAPPHPALVRGPAVLLPIAAAEPGPAWAVTLDATVLGHSGNLRTRLVVPGERVSLGLEWPAPGAQPVRYHWRPVLGTPGAGSTGTLEAGDRATAPHVPGVYELELTAGGETLAFGDSHRVVVTVPFDEKRNGRIGSYHLGNWPTEGTAPPDPYAPPAGFIEVTEANQSLRLSENFTVGQFLTKDQDSVWPKYMALDPKLLDKLELVLLELRGMGVRADRMVVMSGFRTPQYNRFRLGNPATSRSRHQYGDAADVWVDNEDDWYMSDLNGDGRRDMEDARVMLQAVDRVERRHPELVGGAGLYRANSVRGPFIHIDVRGTRARW
jgi:uncharacterized protein YcbK (DUF882 family)